MSKLSKDFNIDDQLGNLFERQYKRSTLTKSDWAAFRTEAIKLLNSGSVPNQSTTMVASSLFHESVKRTDHELVDMLLQKETNVFTMDTKNPYHIFYSAFSSESLELSEKVTKAFIKQHKEDLIFVGAALLHCYESFKAKNDNEIYALKKSWLALERIFKRHPISKENMLGDLLNDINITVQEKEIYKPKAKKEPKTKKKSPAATP